MDVILLQPGDESVFPGPNGLGKGCGPVDGLAGNSGWPESLPKIGQCIELVSLHQGIRQQVSADVSDSARTSGRPVVSEFTCVKYVDQTSVRLYDLCLRAATIGSGPNNPSFLYVMRSSGDKIANIMTFALRDALISEIQFQSQPDDMPTEQFKLNFTEILWTFNEQTGDTKVPGNLVAGWSLARNRPIMQFTE